MSARRGACSAAAVSGALLVLALAGTAAPARAAALHYCDHATPLTARQQDTLLRFAAVVKHELEASGQRLALVARSGLDLSRFGMRYSHAGLSLRSSPNAPWSVRQLYYACDEHRARIYDQGMSGFLLGADSPQLGYLSAVLVDDAAAEPLERAALDDRRALSLLAPGYSANAYAYSVRYQNCNQWVLEVLASAWGDLGGTDESAREQAQRWLRAQGYEPSVFELGSGLWLGLAGLVPWLHSDDHPREDLEALRFRVSMPASIDAFVHASLPHATRIEFCHTDREIVVRHGWEPIGDGCRAESGDTVIALDEPAPGAP